MTSKTTSSDNLIRPMTGTLRGNLAEFSTTLSQWERRDATRPQPEVRHAANTATDAIDAMFCELHEVRARLISEIRASDQAAEARLDALLRRDGAS
jgi:hypothetical protein